MDRRLQIVGAAVITLNVILSVVAVIKDWPSQFGRVGTDAGSDVFLVGTAISAPILPIVVLGGSLWAMTRSGRWASAGLIGFTVVAAAFLIGGFGELLAAATPDVSRAVLTFGGLWWIGAAGVMFATALPRFKRRSTVTARGN